MKILDNRYIKRLLLIVFILIINIIVLQIAKFDIKGNLSIEYMVNAESVDNFQVFYKTKGEWTEEQSTSIIYNTPGYTQKLKFVIPRDSKQIRLDLGSLEEKVILSNISINYLWKNISINSSQLKIKEDSNHIANVQDNGNELVITPLGNDPYIILDLSQFPINSMFKIDKQMSFLFKICIFSVMNIMLLIIIRKYSVIKSLFRELYNNRTLLWNLSKNDFKTKYAGSYLGIFWAFVQPVVTVLIYWFVFQVGFKSAPVDDFPFVLWLVAGIVPWFFFNEAIVNVTNSLTEYSYLVKKVVFKISILPIVKVIAALFVHMFFVMFAVILFSIYGYNPNIYNIQIIYYSLCTFVLALGIGYATCSIVVFFKDLGQIVGIVLQIGMWLTPIMWSYTMLPDKFQWVLKINPMYYIVEGYRDALINQVWFWERYNQTIYFWLITIGIFGVGTIIFKKLKVHFADVL